MSIIDLRGKKPIKRLSEKKKVGLNDEFQKAGEIAWQIPEYEYKPKDVSWYWLSLIAAVILLAFAVWQKNFLFAIFVVIAFFTVNYLTSRFPAIWEIKINEKGIFIGLPNSKSKKFYPLEDIECFDIHSNFDESEKDIEEEYKKLAIKFKSKLTALLKINFYSKDEQRIKEFLSEFAPQKELPKSLTDSLSELIGF